MPVPCRQPWRSRKLPAAQLRRGVGPLESRNAVAGQTQQRDIIGHHQAYSGHIPDIFRAYFGYEMIIACGIARRRTRRHRWSSRVVSPGAGHGVTDGHRVSYRPVPDRVPYGLSPDRVASRPCRVHSPASRRPVVCHAPAQQRL